MKKLSLRRALGGAALALALGLGLHGGAWAAQNITVWTDVTGVGYHNVCGNGDVNNNGAPPCTNGPSVNTVTIGASGLAGTVDGALNNESAVTVSGNTVNVDGQVGDYLHMVPGYISGGSHDRMSTADDVLASGNTVNINFNSTVPYGGTIIGGYARTTDGNAYASGNLVVIAGQVSNGFNRASITGGWAFTSTGTSITTGNTVTIESSASFPSGVDLRGGYASGAVRTSSNNTLNLYLKDLNVGTLDGFQNLNFYLPLSLTPGGTMMNVSGTAYLDGNAITVSPFATGPTGLYTGEWFYLIQGGTISGAIDPASASGTYDGFHYTLAVVRNNLVMTIGATTTATAIDSVDVTVPQPVTGESTVWPTLASGSNFWVSGFAWTPSDNPFAGGTEYTVSVTLTASTGYTFEGLTSATIDGNAATITSNTGGAVTLSYQFQATAAVATPITSAAVTGITAPATGNTPGGSDPSPSGSYTPGAVTWSPSDNPFAAGTVYTATVMLTAESGYTFTGLAAANATIDGNPATIVSNTGDTVTLSYEFPATAALPPTAITSVAVGGVTAPAIGDAPSGAATPAPAGSHYTVGAVTWSPADDPFVANTAYTATVTLTADAGYTFTGLAAAAATLDGKPASVSVGAGGNTVTLSYAFAPLAPRGSGGGDAASVPTLGELSLALLALLLAGMGLGAMRRRG